MTWKQWGLGLLNGAISGLTSGGAANLLGIPLKQAASIAGASFIVSAFKWIAQHPLPGAPTS